jgi:heat shock 70kDa protein 1/2/6/8
MRCSPMTSRRACCRLYSTKRLLGRSFSDDDVQQRMRYWPFVVSKSARNRPTMPIRYQGKRKSLLPEEVCAMVLGEMKRIARARLNAPVQQAVISVPVSFTSGQRQCIRDAAAVAGLEVLRLEVDTVMAGIVRSLELEDDLDGHDAPNVVVVDIGGGCMSTTVYSCDEAVMEVKAMRGRDIGGDDIDNLLITHCAQVLPASVSGTLRAIAPLSAARMHDIHACMCAGPQEVCRHIAGCMMLMHV